MDFLSFREEITKYIFAEDMLQKADIILIPGNAYPQNDERAAALYRQGYAALQCGKGHDHHDSQHDRDLRHKAGIDAEQGGTLRHGEGCQRDGHTADQHQIEHVCAHDVAKGQIAAYEASVAQQTRPDFRKTVETEDSNCEFADLEPGLYIFTVRALYAGNAEFNSDPTQKVVGTLGFAAEKLATPTELAAADVTSSGAKISWAEVSGAANYRVRLTM